MLKKKVLVEWEDKNLNGYVLPRHNDLPLYIELESDNNPSLLGTQIITKFTHYVNGTERNNYSGTTGTTTGLSFTVTEPNHLICKGVVEKESFGTLPSNLDVGIHYSIDAIFPDTSVLTIDSGSFSSVIYI